MKSMIATIGILAALTAAAEVKQLTEAELKLINTSYKQLTPQQREERVRLIRLQELITEGGEMPFPGTPRGTIRFINLQKKVPTADLQKFLSYFDSMLNYDMKIVEQDCDATLKIKIIDDPSAPVMLVAPEDRWAQVNVAKLGGEGVKPTYLAARTRKELMRTFAFLTAGSSNKAPLFASLRNTKHLDKIVENGFPVDIIMRTREYLESMNVVPLEMASYKSVLLNGYDVAPTNDYQRAIYKEVKDSMPLTKKLP